MDKGTCEQWCYSCSSQWVLFSKFCLGFVKFCLEYKKTCFATIKQSFFGCIGRSICLCSPLLQADPKIFWSRPPVTAEIGNSRCFLSLSVELDAHLGPACCVEGNVPKGWCSNQGEDGFVSNVCILQGHWETRELRHLKAFLPVGAPFQCTCLKLGRVVGLEFLCFLPTGITSHDFGMNWTWWMRSCKQRHKEGGQHFSGTKIFF